MAVKRAVVVGAGFFGAVMAERLAADAGLPVTIIDRRGHIGGNSWSETDAQTGVEYHKYGSHIFHTSKPEVWRYISRFTAFNDYRHTVWTTFRDRVYSLPINLATINAFYAHNLSPEQARQLLREEAARAAIAVPRNLEEKALSQLGRPLYEAFIRGYTRKQWGKDPTELPVDIITRLPLRYSYNNRYFSDTFEGIPLHGYGALFAALLAHPKIELRLNTGYADLRPDLGSGLTPSVAPNLAGDTLICYSGAIDEFFDYRLGRLEWRGLDFSLERLDCSDYQGVAVMNYADEEVPHTRVHEFKHYHPERADTGATLICKEYPRFSGSGDEPYYPIETESNRRLYAAYRDLARHEAPGVIFGGRLGSYRYYNMDEAIAAALECYKAEALPRLG